MSCSFNNLLDPDTKVFRYMELSKLLSLIHQKHLFFAKASSFEDSLEGMPTFLDSWMGNGESELLDIVVNHTLPCLLPVSDEEVRTKKKIDRDMALKIYNERTVETILGHQKVEDFTSYSSIFEAVSEWVDVSCWHKGVSATESMAMWKIYGAGSAAICIESTVGDVIAAMDVPDGVKLVCGDVSYLNYETDYVGSENPFNVFFTKSHFYEFESELRFIIYPAGIIDIKKARNELGAGIKIDPKRLIKRVMVSPTSSSWFLELIGLIMKDAGFSLEVVKSKISLR